MAGIQNALELEKTNSRHLTVSNALATSRGNGARQSFADAGERGFEGASKWSKEFSERMFRSTMAVYAWYVGDRTISPQEEQRTGRDVNNGSIKAWQGTGFCVGIERERGADGKEKVFAIVQTNHHVISGPDSEFEYSVELYDGGIGIRKPAEVMYRDHARDLGYIRIDITDTDFVVPLTFADPSSVHPGMEVASVGNSLGHENNFVPGYITGMPTVPDKDDNGDLESPEIKGMYKLNSIVSPGNSGGPTVNQNGEVVGMNTAGMFAGHGSPVMMAIPAEDFATPARHARLFSNVQKRIEPIIQKSFGGGDWVALFNEGVSVYREEFTGLYGTVDNATRQKIHQAVLNDMGMLIMLASTLSGTLIRRSREDIVRFITCLRTLESEFGVKLKMLEGIPQNISNEGEESTEVASNRMRGLVNRDSNNKQNVRDGQRYLRQNSKRD